ncbi:hypothetical protein BJY04DRAFT_214154 [Aspergillus karnatakaensis]|uniref:uncharacterized protein n=1 Tax=Aspergillus karnatakaensis TaxID=1810916 RepID=UPI003CCE0F63
MPDIACAFGRPLSIRSKWTVLQDLGFGTVDAFLPLPLTGKEHEALGKITDKLKALEKAGFDIVDAVIHVPRDDQEVYFFRGTQYVKIHLEDDRITHGPVKIAN